MVQDERDFGGVEREGRGACLEGVVEENVSITSFSWFLSSFVKEDGVWDGRSGWEEEEEKRHSSSRRFKLTLVSFRSPSLLVHRQLASRTPGVEPNFSLPISRFLTALRFSMQDDWLELDDAEAICFSLIEQVRRVSHPHESSLLTLGFWVLYTGFC